MSTVSGLILEEGEGEGVSLPLPPLGFGLFSIRITTYHK